MNHQEGHRLAVTARLVGIAVLWICAVTTVAAADMSSHARRSSGAKASATLQQYWGPPIVNALRFDSLIHETATRHRVDSALVMAVIHAESYFNPKATSHVGAAGLMQLMPLTAQAYGVNDRYNPRQNVDAGVRYLKDLMARYPGKLSFVLAAYNAGESAVDRYEGIPPYDETRDYVKKVLEYRNFYRNWP
ncbi:MAG: lytic transglycosylase domain-containing protein [Pseudomonadota bacterium]|nr:MAG: lytic transglycosylase domain-containing protein [Pseudomonadota bacterium]